MSVWKPRYRATFFVCVEYTKPSFIGLSFLINSLHQNHTPQERKRFIFGLINVGLVSVVYHFWLIHYYKTTGEKRFIFGLIHFCVDLCGLSHNLIISKVAVYLINWLLWNHQRKKIHFWINQYQYWCLWSFMFLQFWKTLQWVCGSPGTELLFLFVCTNTQNLVSVVFHFWLIHFTKTTNHRREKDSVLD